MKVRHLVLILLVLFLNLGSQCGGPGLNENTCLFCCDGRYAKLFLSDSCDGDPDLIEISAEEVTRLTNIVSESTDECVFVTVIPLDGVPIEGYIKNRGRSPQGIWCGA